MSTLAVTLTGIAPATLTIELGTPGPQGPAGPQGSAGPAGPAGPGVPAGGTAGQYLQKIDGTNYNTDWVTLNLSGYAPLASPAFTGNPTAPTAALGDNDTSLATTAFVQQELASGTAVAKNLEVYVRNQTGSTLAAGSIVYINGATGNRPTVTLAQANNDANSAQTMGFVKTAIANNGTGYVIVRGECEGLDTSAVAEGTQLYLSPTVAGAYTTTKPVAPQHMVYVGIVIRSHPTQGTILVAVQNGLELEELHDVLITSPTNGQVLKYNSTTGLWYNGTDSAGVAWGGITGTLSSQTDLQTALDGKYSTTNPAGYITSSALSPYLTSATAASTYFTIANAANKADLASPTFTGNPTAPTPATADNDTSIATTAFVKAQGYLTAAPVTSVAGKTGAVTLANTDITGFGTLSTVNDAPSDGTTYGRNNGAWVAAGGGGGSEADFGFNYADLLNLALRMDGISITGDGGDPETFTYDAAFTILNADILNWWYDMLTNQQAGNTQYAFGDSTIRLYDLVTNALIVGFTLNGGFTNGSVNFTTSQGSGYSGNYYAIMEVTLYAPGGATYIVQKSRLFNRSSSV